MDYTIKIGGEAGQGIQTIGDGLAKVFSRSGYYVFSHQDYESRARGGHNFYQIRFADRPISSSRTGIDILVALDEESIISHERELNEEGMIVYDRLALGEKYQGPHFLHVPFADIAIECGGKKIMANTVAIGAVLGMLGLSIAPLYTTLRDQFLKKGEAILSINEKAATAGRDFAQASCLRCSFAVSGFGTPRMLMGVHDAVGLGAIASGCKFYAAYPMTPSTGVMNFMASRAMEYGILVEQAEDEIAAINMALGASYAGVRAMTGTSGGGFALMVEGLSLAAITETPIVIVLAQRPGPATGLPTKTEQADLLFALHAGHGEFPRVIFAPGDPEEAFNLTNKAFDLAWKYQIPVFVLTDQYLSDAQWTPEPFHLERLIYHDYTVRGDALATLDDYRRHAFTETGVSPMAVPGEASHVVVTDSDEHDEEGHLVEDKETRRRMVEKRLFRKSPHIRAEIDPPLFYGKENPEIVFVCWGSLFGVMREAVDHFMETHSIAMLHFSQVYPLCEGDFLHILRSAKKTVCVEQNATGQFAGLIRAETGHEFHVLINRYDGRPYLLEELIGEIDGCLG